MVAVLHMGHISTPIVDVLNVIKEDQRYETEILFNTDVPGENNRNKIVLKFMSSDCDYLLMIDDDNPPIKNPLDLIGLDKDIIGLPTPQWKGNVMPHLMWMVGKRFPDGYRCYTDKREGIEQVDFVGTGCMIVAKRVFEKIKGPFMRKWNEDGVAVLGQDFHFCERARERGFEIWVNWDYVCNHFKKINLLNII